MIFRNIAQAAAALVLTISSLAAGTLDLAVIQINGLVDAAGINESLRGENLAKATIGDRLDVRDSRLRGVPVLFGQTIGVSPGNKFGSVTRIGAQRAEVEGSLGSNEIQASIAISEGMEAHLRRFSRSVYKGNAPLVRGPVQVLGIRQVDLRSPTVTKGRSKMTTTQLTVLVLYQYRD